MMINGGNPIQSKRMNWASPLCVEDDDDSFFESYDRISSVIPVDLESSGSDDEDDDEYDDSRISFASAAGPPSEFGRVSAVSMMDAVSEEDYNLWMAEPMSIEERRRRLLQGMGLSKSIRVTSAEFRRMNSSSRGRPSPCEPKPKPATTETEAKEITKKKDHSLPSQSPSTASILTRSRSDGSVAAAALKTKDKQQLLGSTPPPPALVRKHSAPSTFCRSNSIASSDGNSTESGALDGSMSPDGTTFFFKIKDLDTGKEFIIKEFRDDGSLNRLSDAETGKQLTMEEFERRLGYSPIVKELLRRVNSQKAQRHNGTPPLSKSFKSSKKKGGGVGVGVGWLKNIKGVANSVSGFIGELEKDGILGRSGRHSSSSSSSPSEWMKVHQHGKSYKELTGLYMCQQIQAHQGSIWSIKFSPDAKYLASAGEDRIIHVWQVLDSEDGSLPSISEEGDYFSSPLHPLMVNGSLDRNTSSSSIAASALSFKKRGKASSSSRKGSSMRENIVVPENIFSLAEKPMCSFQGHLDDVLDLSWSKSQHLLSSSMDKTVRLWDLETKACLKLFAHNDYVTCIQFNPVDDNYFISGSLDAKVRIWSIPDRQVVDWSDLHEMVTAASYTPDGQGALVGSHKGSCRIYDTSDCKLLQTAQIDIQPKKKKNHPKKITGFQFSPGNPSEVLVTSADSQIRIFDGVQLIHKFKGFRNTSSQIAASYTADGKYVVCASEDSQVYVWKREENHAVGGSGRGKSLMTTRSHEHFQCKDVSVAIPWPRSSEKIELPPLPLQSRRHTNPHHSRRSSTQSASSGASSLEEASLSYSSKSHFPPLPKKSFTERTSPCPDEDLANPLRSDSGVGGYLSANSSPARSVGSTSTISFGSFPSSPWRWYDANSSASAIAPPATAWGLVIVTAGLGGEIRTYQNFGLPVRLSRQGNLF